MSAPHGGPVRLEPSLALRKPPILEAGNGPALRAERRDARAQPRALRKRRFSVGRWLRWTLLTLASLVPVGILALRWLPPPTTAFMLQSPTQPVRYVWVPAERIAPVARRAVVAAEDQKFWQHDGFDFEAIEKAQQHNRRSSRRRGASTISQQTAKNLFLWPGGGYFRKGIEAGLTVLIEALWSKQRILEVYLNIAEFGPGVFGVEAAAQAYFGKSAGRLSAAEAARLAAVLPSPRRWSARAPGPYVQSRASWILGQVGHRSRSTPGDEPLPPASGAESDEADEALDQGAPGPGYDEAPQGFVPVAPGESPVQTEAAPLEPELSDPVPVEPEAPAPEASDGDATAAEEPGEPR